MGRSFLEKITRVSRSWWERYLFISSISPEPAAFGTIPPAAGNRCVLIGRAAQSNPVESPRSTRNQGLISGRGNPNTVSSSDRPAFDQHAFGLTLDLFDTIADVPPGEDCSAVVSQAISDSPPFSTRLPTFWFALLGW